MSVNLLNEDLKELQKSYKNVLLKAKDNISSRVSFAIIDELNVFWYKNRKLVEFILRNLIKPYEAYAFTGATILDFEELEHYPFVSLGEFHIWDDPSCVYVNMIDDKTNSVFNKLMKKQIIATIKDNIEILESANDIINILPIRYLLRDTHKLVDEKAMEAFLSLFEKEYSFEEYLKTFCTIKDIKDSLRLGIEQNIIFTENENTDIDIETRFRKYKSTTSMPLSKKANDAEIFWNVVFGYISQAFNILYMCINYQLCPYIRSDITFKYLVILAENFKDKEEIKKIIFRGAVAHILHHEFNKERVKNINFKRYYKIIQESNFDNRLFSQLEKQRVTVENIDFSIIGDAIKCLLNSIF